jgi:hypothetical protein
LWFLMPRNNSYCFTPVSPSGICTILLVHYFSKGAYEYMRKIIKTNQT